MALYVKKSVGIPRGQWVKNEWNYTQKYMHKIWTERKKSGKNETNTQKSVGTHESRDFHEWNICVPIDLVAGDVCEVCKCASDSITVEPFLCRAMYLLLVVTFIFHLTNAWPERLNAFFFHSCIKLLLLAAWIDYRDNIRHIYQLTINRIQRYCIKVLFSSDQCAYFS